MSPTVASRVRALCAVMMILTSVLLLVWPAVVCEAAMMSTRNTAMASCPDRDTEQAGSIRIVDCCTPALASETGVLGASRAERLTGLTPHLLEAFHPAAPAMSATTACMSRPAARLVPRAAGPPAGATISVLLI